MKKEHLFKLFESEDKYVKVFVFKSILKHRLEGLDKLIAEGLQDSREEVALAALSAATYTRNPALARMASDYLNSASNSLKEEAVRVLSTMNFDFLIPMWLDFFKTEKDLNLKSQAVMALKPYKRQELLEFYKKLMSYEDSRIRANAVEAIGQLNGTEAEKALNDSLDDNDNRVRINAAKALVEKGKSGQLYRLYQDLHSDNSKRRASLAYLHGEILSSKGYDDLILLLEDRDPAVRKRAAISLSKYDAPNIIEILCRAYSKESDKTVRTTIAAASADFNPDKAMQMYLEAFQQSSDNYFKSTLVADLALAQKIECLPLFIKALEDKERRVVANAVEAIGMLKNPDLADIIKSFLEASDNRIRANAVAALWRMGWGSAGNVLKKMAVSGQAEVRQSAAWAIGQIGVLQFLDLLEKLAEDYDPRVRKTAIKAMEKVKKKA
ncbi:MAG: HEAT repeat domain-containing protein [Candidatus Riflebacteria bacterium]|nr:HEAT repeat domain-containing protein [Candidatus Riflebacteria bacterium]